MRRYPYRRRPPFLLPLLLLLFLSFVCATSTSSKVHHSSSSTTISIASSSALISRIRTLRARLRAVRSHRKNLDRERFTLQSSIISAREHIELNQLREARGVDDPHNNINEKKKSRRDLLEVNALISAFVSKKEELDRAIALLTVEANRLTAERQLTLARLQAISLEDIFASHASALPPVMQGALRKSAHVLTPFFDTLVTAADTNDRLVNHVGAEIDKYTHMGIRASPFMSGMLFYCVALIPALTLVLLVRTFIDSSTKWSASHFIVLANIYFIASCLILAIATIAQPHHDPFRTLCQRYEKFVVVCNLIMPLYYCWFIGSLFIETIDTFERRNISQLVASTAIGLHYFTFAWSKIFTDKHPQLLASNYLIYATIFMFITYERCQRINARWLTKSPIVRYMRSMDVKLSYSTISIALPAIVYMWNKIARIVAVFVNQLHQDAMDLWQRCRHRRRRKNTRRTSRGSRDRTDSRHHSSRGSRGSIVASTTAWTRGRKFSIFSRNTASEDDENWENTCSDTSESEDEAYRSKQSETHPLLQRLRDAIFRR